MKFDRRGAVRAHAMQVLASSEATVDDRMAARAELTQSAPDIGRNLSPPQRRMLGTLIRLARGEDEAGRPLPQDASARRGRAQSDALDAIRAAERACATCAQVWSETGGRWVPPRPMWMTVEDHLNAIAEIDPRGEQLRDIASETTDDAPEPATRADDDLDGEREADQAAPVENAEPNEATVRRALRGPTTL